jgi:hypothetical protein
VLGVDEWDGNDTNASIIACCVVAQDSICRNLMLTNHATIVGWKPARSRNNARLCRKVVSCKSIRCRLSTFCGRIMKISWVGRSNEFTQHKQRVLGEPITAVHYDRYDWQLSVILMLMRWRRICPPQRPAVVPWGNPHRRSCMHDTQIVNSTRLRNVSVSRNAKTPEMAMTHYMRPGVPLGNSWKPPQNSQNETEEWLQPRRESK